MTIDKAKPHRIHELLNNTGALDRIWAALGEMDASIVRVNELGKMGGIGYATVHK